MIAGGVDGTKVDPQDGSKVQGAKSEGMQQLHCSEVNGILVDRQDRSKVQGAKSQDASTLPCLGNSNVSNVA